MKIIKMTDHLNDLIQRSDNIFLPDGRMWAQLANMGFLEENGYVKSFLADFNVFLGVDIQVQKYQLIPLKKWFRSEEVNLIDSLRSFARKNQIELSAMVGAVGKLIVVNKKDENNREISTIIAFEPEFDEEFILSA